MPNSRNHFRAWSLTSTLNNKHTNSHEEQLPRANHSEEAVNIVEDVVEDFLESGGGGLETKQGGMT